MIHTLFQCCTAWAEWRGGFFKNSTDSTPAKTVWHPHHADFHTPGEMLTVHALDWSETVDIYQFHSSFNKHGHNWWMTSRLDFWFYPANDPFEWHGHLITGGINSTFKVRRSLRRNAFTGWSRFQRPPVAVEFIPGATPVWRASFANGPDKFTVRGPRFWTDWIVAKSPEECLRQLVLIRLNLQAA